MPHHPNEILPRSVPASARARLARALRRREIRAAVGQASKVGMQVWMVGGAIRDLLLGRAIHELDLATSGDPQRLAAALSAAGFGTTVLLSDETPRVFRVAGDRDLDIAEIVGGSIEADLARRDFTVNAIACTLPEGRLFDPFGGVDDLERGRLRAISDRNLLDDPLRVLRAARLMATHGFSPDRSLTEGSRSAAASISGAAAERVRSELIKLLSAEASVPALDWLRSVGALGPVLGLEVERFRRIPLLDHRQLRRSLPVSRVGLRLCLIAHRAGLSPSEAAAWLRRRRFSGAEAGDVATLLELAERVPAIRSSRGQWEWIRDAGSRRTEAATLASLLYPSYRRAAQRLARPLPARRCRVGGVDVLAWTSVSPGPLVGRILRQIEIEILRGTIRSRREARRWLRKQYGDPSRGSEKRRFRL